MNLNIKAMTLAFGLFWGIAIFFWTWWWIIFHDPSNPEIFLDKFYFGYSVTPIGSIVGFMWGFVDGAIGGLILAWLYNKFNN